MNEISEKYKDESDFGVNHKSFSVDLDKNNT